jgi:hypothetical protein
MTLKIKKQTQLTANIVGSTGQTKIAVKITDTLGEEVLVTKQM